MPSVTSAMMRGTLEVIYTNGGNVTQNISRRPLRHFTNGNGALQANRVYDTDDTPLTLTASATQTYNLSSLADKLGNTITATKIKGILIEHLPSSVATGGITVGGGTGAVFGTKLVDFPLLPGEHIQLCLGSGYTVTATTADKLRIINADSSNTATVRVTLLLSQ